MFRSSTKLLVIVLLLLFVIVFGAMLPRQALAAELLQATDAGEPPPVESFGYLLEDSAPQEWRSLETPAAEVDESEAQKSYLAMIEPIQLVDPYYPTSNGMTVNVGRGCGGLYHMGEYIQINTFVPIQGYLTIWSSVNGGAWRLFNGPRYVYPGTTSMALGVVAPPTGFEILYARLQTAYGGFYDQVCYFYSTGYGNAIYPPVMVEPTPNTAIYPTPAPPAVSAVVEPRSVVPVTSGLYCSASAPTSVSPGVPFRQTIHVSNPVGNPTATGIMFYARVEPQGYTPIISCAPDCTPTRGLLVASLGTLYPGQSKTVSIDAYGPAVPGQSFNWRYSTLHVGHPERSCGSTSLRVAAVSNGGWVIQGEP